uniref:Uncharacterized protein n=2 Tax=Tetraselmis sp. GSL018 TaxID=582737 RepID=A0A061RVP8_9CHLO
MPLSIDSALPQPQTWKSGACSSGRLPQTEDKTSTHPAQCLCMWATDF